LARSEREGREIAVLFCDLDGFKQVNDTAGHAAGDAVLVETARRLRLALREGDTVARVGGDEFVLIVEPWNRSATDDSVNNDRDVAHDRGLALRVADRVVSALRVPVKVQEVDYAITISVGITYPSLMNLDGQGIPKASDVMKEADEAMYWAKHQGKDRFAVFAEDLDGDAALR
jgi:diguanylate cyclase (GGDEF)-like protein